MSELTKNQTLVLNVLAASGTPLSAYAILDALRDEGLRAPLQVYRALDSLMAFGNVHRLESLNAFVACSHPKCGMHSNVAFTICEKCSNVSEITDEKLTSQLTELANKRRFSLSKSTIELRGLCSECQPSA